VVVGHRDRYFMLLYDRAVRHVTYYELKELICDGTVVYGITEGDIIVSGRIISVRSYREALLKDVFSDSPEIDETNNLYVTVRLGDGITCNVRDIFLTYDEAKNELAKRVNEIIAGLSAKIFELELEVDMARLLTRE